MRVLMTTDTIGGVWTYTRELSLGLLETGWSVILVSMGRLPSPEQESWVSSVRGRWPQQFVFVGTDYKLEWMQENAGCYEGSRDMLLDCVQKYSPDILHSNQFCYGMLPVAIPKCVVAHSDVLSWWAACRGGMPEPSAWVACYCEMVTEGIRGATVLVAPTAWLLNEICATYGVRLPTAVIHNGRTVQETVCRERKLQAVTAGRIWDEAKNVDVLTALRTVLPVYVAGDNMFESGRVDDPDLHYLGRLAEDKVLWLFAESSIYVATSKYEPFGLAPLEAALSGCALVVNDIPSLREVWRDSAIYFAANDPASLRKVVQQLVDSPALLRIAAQHSGARARLYYSREQMTSEYLKLYQSLRGSRTGQYAA